MKKEKTTLADFIKQLEDKVEVRGRMRNLKREGEGKVPIN